MANFVRGRKFGRLIVQISGAPFLFCNSVHIGKCGSWWGIRFRQFELASMWLPDIREIEAAIDKVRREVSAK